MAKLIYGLIDGNLVHINDAKQGLECGCLCPNCNSKLVAKKGKKNEYHFAHESKECDITIAQETALHIMAKEILSEVKTIKLPKVILEDKYAFLSKEEYFDANPYVVNLKSLYFRMEKYKDSIHTVDNVIIEKYLENIKPDVLIETNGKKLLIEIAVTHFIDDKKKKKIIELGIPTVEINLSSYKDKIENLTKEELTEIITNRYELKQWIYYKNRQEDINNIINYNRLVVDKTYWLLKYCNKYFTQRYQYCYSHNNFDDKHFNNYWNKQSLSKKMLVPWFVNIPIEGDILFNVDRRIWQTMIISKMYFNKNISLDSIINSIQGMKISREPNYYVWVEKKREIGNRLIELENADARSLIKNNKNIEDVVKNYYAFLKEQGIIDENGTLNQNSLPMLL